MKMYQWELTTGPYRGVDVIVLASSLKEARIKAKAELNNDMFDAGYDSPSTIDEKKPTVTTKPLIVWTGE